MRLRLLLLAAVLLAAGAEPPKSDNKRPKQPAAQPNRTEPALGTNQPAEKGKKITGGKGVTIPPPTGSVTRLQAQPPADLELAGSNTTLAAEDQSKAEATPAAAPAVPSFKQPTAEQLWWMTMAGAHHWK